MGRGPDQNTIPFNDVALEPKKPGNIACVFSNNNFIVQTGDGFLYVNKYSTEKKIKIEKNQTLKSFQPQNKNGTAINGVRYSDCYKKLTK